MPILRLTKKSIDELPFGNGRQIFYHDSELSGFGLRVSAKTKTYFVQKAVHGRTVRTTIGKHVVFTLEQARKEAMAHLVDMTKGINPNRVKRDKQVEIINFMQAFESRLAAKSEKLSSRTISDYKMVVRLYFRDWWQRSLEDITKNMIMQRYGDITKKHGADAATKAMRVFSATYNYARYLNAALPENPVVILSLTKSWHATKRTQTVIKPNQLPVWYKAVLAEPNEIMRDYFLFLLFTGLRRSEAAQLKWSDIDSEALTFTVRKTKNGYPHTLPVSNYVEELLKRRFQNKINDYVFSGNNACLHINDPRKAICSITKSSGVKFSPHDLRRTFVTTAEKLDISHYTVKYLINHRTNNDLTGGYIVLDIERMREPMKRIEEKLLELIKNYQ